MEATQIFNGTDVMNSLTLSAWSATPQSKPKDRSALNLTDCTKVNIIFKSFKPLNLISITSNMLEQTYFHLSFRV